MWSPTPTYTTARHTDTGEGAPCGRDSLAPTITFTKDLSYTLTAEGGLRRRGTRVPSTGFEFFDLQLQRVVGTVVVDAEAVHHAYPAAGYRFLVERDGVDDASVTF